jgi:hypothetical protein
MGFGMAATFEEFVKFALGPPGATARSVPVALGNRNRLVAKLTRAEQAASVTTITANCRRMCSFGVQREATMSTILTYNPVLIDERNERPFLIAAVAILAVWAVAFLIAVA